MSQPMPTLFVIPTGIRCSVGGFAGDAIPTARLLAAASGCLITHPNVMNAASLFWSDQSIHYVEGYSLDRFASGEIALRPVRQQKVGLLLDAGLEKDLRQRHLQVVDACRASLGLNIGPITTTEVPLEIVLNHGSNYASWGEILNPEVLLKAGESLKHAGATAIAVVTRFPDLPYTDDAIKQYRHGQGVDIFGGAEAIISHLLVRHLSLPCAHAPALNPLPIDPDIDPRAAAEEIGYTFLPSVLVGLSRAPDLLLKHNDGIPIERDSSSVIHADQIGAIVAPDGALGGEAVLACIERGIPIVAVSNPALMKVNSESLGLNKNQVSSQLDLIHARDYVEASGFLLALREGIAIETLQRPLQDIFNLDMP